MYVISVYSFKAILLPEMKKGNSFQGASFTLSNEAFIDAPCSVHRYKHR